MNLPSTVVRPRAWVLNLDAELELMHPKGYQPNKGSLAACARFSPQARTLLQPRDLELLRSQPVVTGCADGYGGAAWCPTPSVIALLNRAGAPIEHAPSLNCLQTVNHRRFNAHLGQTLPDATFLTQRSDVSSKLSEPSPGGWMVKRGFGFASRGVRRMPQTPTQDDARWLTHALEYGGLQIEPWLPIIAEYSLHGYVSTQLPLRLGQPCQLLDSIAPSYVRVAADCDPDATRSLSAVERAALFLEAERTASALSAVGYLGPFGIDAFAYSWQGKRQFNPRSEVNARYTLAYAVGMHRDA